MEMMVRIISLRSVFFREGKGVVRPEVMQEVRNIGLERYILRPERLEKD